jgi:predicted DNA-binding protein (UPF0278 family)
VARSIFESPDTFGSMQTKIQGMISTLIAVSGITDGYTREGRLDAASRSDLLQLAKACQGTLGRLEGLRAEFERWGTQSIRQEELSEMTDVLNEQIQGLEGINEKIR